MAQNISKTTEKTKNKCKEGENIKIKIKKQINYKRLKNLFKKR